MAPGKIGRPEPTPERPAEGVGGDVLPETTVQASRRQAGARRRCAADGDPVAFDDGDPGAGRRELPLFGQGEEPGIGELDHQAH